MYPGYAGYGKPQQGSASSPYVDPGAAPRWGAPVMGSPANPGAHPDNQQAAASTRLDPLQAYGTPVSYENSAGPYTKAYTFNGVPSSTASASNPIHSGVATFQPGGSYIRTDPVSVKGPMDSVLKNLGNWGKKAEVMAGNIWSHLKTGPSLTDTAWGKLNKGTKLLCEGGLENIFRTSFEVTTNEELRKSYACYLSTSTGPVAGTLFISTAKLAFCSDRPLPYSSSAGKQTWSYYKEGIIRLLMEIAAWVVIPLEYLKAVNSSANIEKPAEKYIQIVTVDNHEFWFMGFVNYEKGLKVLQEAALFRGDRH
ncbi:hypothetical protein O6H91_14G020800 [Diphasiastrum complanatum]|uniref:Uncharacterized protein n=1 Tax=Diphasiastrum complanatum TaxID=34168 RepID=A0ACC2BM32_DIPCM|nr:hypothetical protein O6H91_14G020800 [Diphasiastrum complanatum]